MRLRFIKLSALFVVTCVTFEVTAATAPPSKSEAVAFFSSLKKQNTVRLQETDKAIMKKLDETQGTRVLAELHTEIEKLRSDKKELLLRQDFLDRMILQFDANYDGQHPKDFLEKTLKSMTQVEISSNQSTTIWPFLDNLRRLIARVPDTQDRVLNLVEGYMKQTSIAHPMMPDDFLAHVAYSNGSQSEGAHPMPRTEVGAYADKRLKQIAAAPIGKSTMQEKLVIPAAPADTEAAPTIPPAAGTTTTPPPGYTDDASKPSHPTEKKLAN